MWTHHKNFSFALFDMKQREMVFGVSVLLVDEWHKIQSNFPSFFCWCRWFILHEKRDFLTNHHLATESYVNNTVNIVENPEMMTKSHHIETKWDTQSQNENDSNEKNLLNVSHDQYFAPFKFKLYEGEWKLKFHYSNKGRITLRSWQEWKLLNKARFFDKKILKKYKNADEEISRLHGDDKSTVKKKNKAKPSR